MGEMLEANQGEYLSINALVRNVADAFMKELADQIQGHAVQKAVDAIGDSYTDVNPLLPFP